MTKEEKYLARQEKKQKKIEKQRLLEEEQLRLDEKYMKEAIKQAKKAGKIGEVPIGCVIVYDNRIIGRGYNRRNKDRTVLAHAEIVAIKKACKYLGDWRLEGCTLYVTLEPCSMCAGSIIQARLDRVVIGAMNKKAGSAGSVINMFEIEGYNHHPKATYKVLENECSHILTNFFKELRFKKFDIKAADLQESDCN